MATETHGDANQCIHHLLHRACQLVHELFVHKANGVDLTPRQFAILEAISKDEGLSQTALVERTGIDRSTVADITGRLLRKRLVTRRRRVRDERTYAVSLTPLGRTALSRAAPIVAKVDQLLLSALSPQDVRQFMNDLMLIAGVSSERGIRQA